MFAYTKIMQAMTAASSGFTVVQTFLASGTWTAPTGVTSVDYLVVAGGGGGAQGGGGAGGFRTGTGLAVTAGTDYTITVGGGGTGGNTAGSPAHTNGGNSTFSTITSNGGGYGSSASDVNMSSNYGNPFNKPIAH